jgi:hypothetical protein
VLAIRQPTAAADQGRLASLAAVAPSLLALGVGRWWGQAWLVMSDDLDEVAVFEHPHHPASPSSTTRASTFITTGSEPQHFSTASSVTRSLKRMGRPSVAIA